MAGFTGTSCVPKTESSRCTATPQPGRSISIWLTRVSFPRFLNHIPEGRRRFRRRSRPASRWFGNACQSKSEHQGPELGTIYLTNQSGIGEALSEGQGCVRWSDYRYRLISLLEIMKKIDAGELFEISAVMLWHQVYRAVAGRGHS